jgi:cytochrome c-type biogenesis protein CcmH/NrfG
VTATLNNLGNLYSNTQRLKEAADAYSEALQTQRNLAKDNPQAYLPDVARTLDQPTVNGRIHELDEQGS